MLLGGVRQIPPGGVRLSLLLTPASTALLSPVSGTDAFLSGVDNLLFWFLRDVLKLSSLSRSLAMLLSITLVTPTLLTQLTSLHLPAAQGHGGADRCRSGAFLPLFLSLFLVCPVLALATR